MCVCERERERKQEGSRSVSGTKQGSKKEDMASKELGERLNEKCGCCLSACTRMDESRMRFWPLTATSGTRICRLYRDTWLRI